MSFTIRQNLFVNDSTAVTIVRCNEDALTLEHLRPLLDPTGCVLGISATYGKQCQLSSIAFSTLSHALVINVPASHVPQPKDKARRQRVAKSRGLIQDQLLLNPTLEKYAFKMDQLAVALHLDLSIRINDAVDMLSVTNASRQSLQALMNAMGGEVKLNRKNVIALFFATSVLPAVDSAAGVALQAWAACRAATLPDMSLRFASLRRIHTKPFRIERLDAVASISRYADRLDAMKPTAVKNDVRPEFTISKDAIGLVCDRFSTRIRKSNTQVLEIEIEDKKKAKSQITGRPRRVDGRSAHVTVDGRARSGKIVSVTTIGKEDPTCAESVRQDVILTTLQHNTNIFSNPFFRALWLPKERPVWPEYKGHKNIPLEHLSRPLNPSQCKAVQSILSDQDEDRVVVIQGPPGTGKTTVIAASVISHDCANSSQGIWIAAQSNVAVKNIAEKFAKEDFYGFKILVSKEFHYDWHEHLYPDVERCLIRSDNFQMSVVAAERQLLGCKVILCTLSMLSNPQINVFLHVVPMNMLILDEASQIECGNYLPIFHLFHSTLAKIVFIGDHKQLPPYGQEDIQELRSIFEFPHLRQRARFLDTQYRMPHVIGTFISRNVYGGKLRTEHRVTTPTACRLVDVIKGREVKRGHSWINEAEAGAVIKIAELYTSKGLSFRIITPYDAQRSLIEGLLKRERLPWQNKVFNVDSFQGNEDDHIIISVVRSQRPGFLSSQRRTNVMLTRCKQCMIICSSRAFLLGNASKTLVGKLAASLPEENWISLGRRDVIGGLSAQNRRMYLC